MSVGVTKGAEMGYMEKVFAHGNAHAGKYYTAGAAVAAVAAKITGFTNTALFAVATALTGALAFGKRTVIEGGEKIAVKEDNTVDAAHKALLEKAGITFDRKGALSDKHIHEGHVVMDNTAEQKEHVLTEKTKTVTNLPGASYASKLYPAMKYGFLAAVGAQGAEYGANRFAGVSLFDKARDIVRMIPGAAAYI